MEIGEFVSLEEEVWLFYDEEHNYFLNENGQIITNIFDYITPGDLLMFKESKMCADIRNYRHGIDYDQVIILIYPDPGAKEGDKDEDMGNADLDYRGIRFQSLER